MLSYEKLPSDVLVQFYFEIRQNIQKDILSDRMYQELELIKRAAKNQGIDLIEFDKDENEGAYKLVYV